MSLDEIVVDHHFMTVVHQLFSDDTADVTGASGNKHTHAINLRKGTVTRYFCKSVFSTVSVRERGQVMATLGWVAAASGCRESAMKKRIRPQLSQVITSSPRRISAITCGRSDMKHAVHERLRAAATATPSRMRVLMRAYMVLIDGGRLANTC